MKTISADIVEQTWKEMAGLSERQATKLTQQMADQQPFLLNYLATAGEDLNEDEAGLVLYLGLVVWRMMSRGDKPLWSLGEEEIDAKEEKNIQMLEYLKGETAEDYGQTVQTLWNNYNQPEVLKYVLDCLMEDPVEGKIFREENMGLALLHLKTVIDCLDR